MKCHLISKLFSYIKFQNAWERFVQNVEHSPLFFREKRDTRKRQIASNILNQKTWSIADCPIEYKNQGPIHNRVKWNKLLTLLHFNSGPILKSLFNSQSWIAPKLMWFIILLSSLNHRKTFRVMEILLTVEHNKYTKKQSSPWDSHGSGVRPRSRQSPSYDVIFVVTLIM